MFNVGAIVSKLQLDKKGWDSSVKGVKADQTALAGFAERHGAAMKKMGMAMTVAGGAIVGSIGLMVKKYVEAGDQVHKMALRTGFATETLSELKYAAEIAGADITALEKGTKKMSKTIVDASEGMTTYIRAFKRIGLEVKELQGLNPEEQFLKIGNAIASVNDPTIRAASAVDIFGRAGTQLLPLFSQGVKGMEELRQKARELGVVFDQEAADKAARLADAQVTLKSALSGVSKSIAETFIPMLSSLAEKIAAVISKVTDWMKKNPGLTSTITAIVAGLGAFVLALGPLLIALPGIVTAVGLMSTSLIVALGPITAITAAVGVATVTFLKWKAAKDATREAAEREIDVLRLQGQRWGEVAKAMGLTGSEMTKLQAKYKDNLSAMFRAIKAGKEGKELQEAYTETIKKLKKEMDKQKKSTFDLSDAQDFLAEAYKKPAEVIGNTLIPAMNDLRGVAYNTQKELAQTVYAEGIPAYRDLSDVVGQATGDMKSDFYIASEKIKEATNDIGIRWADMADGIRTSWINNLSDALKGAKSFEDALKGVWGTIKDQFFDMVSKMVAKWTLQFVGGILKGGKDLLGGLKDTFKGIGGFFSSLFGGGGGGGGGVASIIGGGASAAGGIWTGIGSAVGTFVGGLFNKSYGKQQVRNLRDIAWWLETIQEHIEKGTNLGIETMNAQLHDIKEAGWTRGDVLKDIKKNTRDIYSALTHKGTIYVDVFRSGAFEGVGKNIAKTLNDLKGKLSKDLRETSKQEMEKADKIKNQLEILELETENVIKTMQEKLEIATKEEQNVLKATMEQVQKEADSKRHELLKQLESIEASEREHSERARMDIVGKLENVKGAFSVDLIQLRENLIGKLENVKTGFSTGLVTLGSGIMGHLDGLGSHLGGRLSEIASEVSALDLNVEVNVDAPKISGIVDAIEDLGDKWERGIPEFQRGGTIEAGPREPTLLRFGEGPQREVATISNADKAVSPAIIINNEWNLLGGVGNEPKQLEDMFRRNVREMTEKIKRYLDRY